FYYSTENKKINLNRLRADLRRRFRTQIEMQLIGPRDVAKMMGGHGACGGPRCCSTFLTEFSPISIKMAKEQGISLNPQEITGMCGRLRCCLIYEYEQYVEAKKQLPRRGKVIGTPWGEGRVRDVLAMRDAVIVELADGDRREVSREQIEPLEELEALKAKAEAGCSKHEGGGCDCGAKSSAAPADTGTIDDDVDDDADSPQDAGSDLDITPPPTSGSDPSRDTGPERPASDPRQPRH